MFRDIRAYVGFIWKSNRALIIFAMAFVASVQLLLIYLNSTLDIAPMMEVMITQLPPQVRDVVGSEILSQITPEGTVAFGMEHPLVITLIAFIIISMVTRNIGSGSGNYLLEIVLAHPFKRKVLFNSLYFFTLLAILFMVVSLFIGALTAMYFFHDLNSTIFKHMLQSYANAFFLNTLILGYTMFFSVYLKDISAAVRYSAIVTLVFYFIDILADLWEKIAFTKYFNFFAYFDPSEIMIGYEWVYRDMGILFAGTVILYFVSRIIFIRKDIF